MANVIEIIIKATDQATNQIKGAKNAAQNLSESFANLAGVVMSPAGVAAAIGAAGLAAIEMTNRFSESIEQLHNLSTVSGVSINQLRTLQQVMVEAGKSPDTLNAALAMMRRKLEDNDPALRKIVGNTNDVYEALIRLSRAGGTASQAFKAFGRGGLELAAILPGLADQLESVHKRLGDLSPDTIRLAGQWDKLMDHMNTATKRFMDGSATLFLKFLDFIAKYDAGAGGMAARAAGFGPESPTDILKKRWEEGADFFDKHFGAGAGGAGAGLPNPLTTDVVGIRLRMQKDYGLSTKALGEIFDGWNKIDKAIQQTKPHLAEFQQAMEDIRDIAQHEVADFLINAFDALAFHGANAARMIRDAFVRAFEEIANAAVRFGLSKLLAAAGLAFGGPVGGFIAGVGTLLGSSQRNVRGGGNVTINAIDSQSMVQSWRNPSGGMRNAMSRLAVGTSY